MRITYANLNFNGRISMVMISWDDWLPDGSLGRRGGMFEVERWWKGVPLLSFWEELEVVIRLGTGGVCIEPRSLAWALEFMDRRALWAEAELINGRQSLIHGCTVLHHSSLSYTNVHTAKEWLMTTDWPQACTENTIAVDNHHKVTPNTCTHI